MRSLASVICSDAKNVFYKYLCLGSCLSRIAKLHPSLVGAGSSPRWPAPTEVEFPRCFSPHSVYRPMSEAKYSPEKLEERVPGRQRSMTPFRFGEQPLFEESSYRPRQRSCPLAYRSCSRGFGLQPANRPTDRSPLECSNMETTLSEERPLEADSIVHRHSFAVRSRRQCLARSAESLKRGDA